MTKTLIWAVALILSTAVLSSSMPPAQAQVSRLPGPPLSTDPVEPEFGPDAEHGRIPIYEPRDITEPGHYFLARNIVAAGVAIRILSDDVTLDLNGNTISRVYAPDPDFLCPGGAIITAQGSRITVRNGSVIPEDLTYGLCSGITARGNNIRIERVHTLGVTGISVNGFGNAPAEHVEILNNSYRPTTPDQWGIVVTANGARISGNSIQARQGMVLEVSNAEISGNQIIGCEGYGIQVEGSGNVLRDNSIRCHDGGSGIALLSGSGNLIAENIIKFNYNGIFSAGSGNRIQGNVVSESSNGIQETGSSDLIKDNFFYNIYNCAIDFQNGNGHFYGSNLVAGPAPPGTCVIPAGNIDLGGNVGL